MKNKLTIILSSLISIFLVVGTILAANQFPTALNNWQPGNIIESDWANALETKIGIDNSADTNSIDYLIKNAASKLGSIANITPSDGSFIVGDGSKFVGESNTTARTSIGLGNVENVALSTWGGSENILTVGTIATGTWQGTVITNPYIADDITLTNITQITNRDINDLTGSLAIASTTGILINSRGGTGQDTSAWSGFIKLTSGTWGTTTIDISDDTNLTAGRSLTLTGDDIAADDELYTDSFAISIPTPDTTDSGYIQKSFPKAITITKVICSVATSTASTTIQFDERAYATPNTAGTDVMSASLICDNDSEATTTFANASIAVDNPLNLQIIAVSGVPEVVRIQVYYMTSD